MIEFPSFAPVVNARFVSRPNRFIAIGELPNGNKVRIHMPNPGRLRELLTPRAILYLQFHGDTERKTKYSCVAVERDGEPVFLHTTRNNDVAHYLIEHGKIPSLHGVTVIRKEITVGNSRFDFLLRKEGKEVLMEVKSVTLFGRGIALFPDAITERGKKHLLELAELSSEKSKPIVLFLIHNSNVETFSPDYHTDLDFSRTLWNVKDQLQIIPFSIGWTPKLKLKKKMHEATIPWNDIGPELNDSGGFVAVLRSARSYYLYTETVREFLQKRLDQFKRKKAGRLLEIGPTELVDVFPFRQSKPDLCPLALDFARIYDSAVYHKKEKCHCVSHLVRTDENPMNLRTFHDLIDKYRMIPLET